MAKQLCEKCGKTEVMFRGAAVCDSCNSASVSQQERREAIAKQSSSPVQRMATRDRVGLSLLGVFVVSMLVFAFTSIADTYSDARESVPREVIAPPDPNAYCPGLMQDLYVVVTDLGNAGSTASVFDIVTILKEVGTRLSTGYDLQLAGTADRLTAIKTAGLAMLEIRVALLDGGDVNPPALVLKESVEYIAASCS